MKIKKTISITATRKEIETIGNFITLFDEMYEDVWDEINKSTGGRLEDALATISNFYDTLDCVEDDDD